MDNALDGLERSSAAFFCLLDESTRGDLFRMRQESPVAISADAVACAIARAIAVRRVTGRVEGAGAVRAAVGRAEGGERWAERLLNGAGWERRSHAGEGGMPRS